MKKILYAGILSLVAVSGFVFANYSSKNEASQKLPSKPLTDAESREARKQWEASPAGIQYTKWAASAEGKKVFTAAAKIRKHIADSSQMEAVVSSLSLPPGARLGFGIMVRMNDEDYILRFDDDPQQLRSLKLNDKIIIKSHSVSHAPKYAYPIISGEYAEREGTILYKHAPRKGGC